MKNLKRDQTKKCVKLYIMISQWNSLKCSVGGICFTSTSERCIKECKEINISQYCIKHEYIKK